MMAIHSSALALMGDAALRGAAAAAAVGAGLWLLRVRSVAAQKTAWTLVLAGAIAMPALAPWAAQMAWLPRWIPDAAAIADAAKARIAAMREARVHAAPASSTLPAKPGETLAIADATPAQPHITHLRMDAAPLAPAAATSRATGGIESPLGPQYPAPEMERPVQSTHVTVAEIALALYLGVATALLLRLLYGLAIAARLWEEGFPVAAGQARQRVRVHNEITSPVTIGSGILLPAEFSQWDAEKLRIVLAHEGEHVRQGDFYLQLAAGLYAAVFWFSPLGWWLKHKLSDLGEAMSDRAAVHEAESRASYAQILLEFAMQPHAIQMGVAMARGGKMTERMERLLNETRFEQAFRGGRGRVLTAAVLVSLAIFAATALARVEAKAQSPANGAQQIAPASTQVPATDVQQSAPASTPSSTQAPAQAPATGVSHPDDAPITTAPAPAPEAAPAPPVAPAAPAPNAAPNIVFTPAPNVIVNPPKGISIFANPDANVSVQGGSASVALGGSGNFWQEMDDRGNGDSYAVITGHGRPINSHAHSLPSGDYLWFTRDGKEYVITDPQVLARIHALYQPMKSLGEQMKARGKQQKEEADRMRAEINAKLAASGFNKQELDKEMAEFRARQPEFEKEMTALKEQLANISIPKIPPVDEKQLADLKRQMAALQATQPDFNDKLNDLINRMVQLQVPKINPIDEKKMAEINKEINEATQKFLQNQSQLLHNSAQYQIQSDVYKQLGEQMSKLGAEQGRLGSQMGRMAHDADRQIRSIINESLKNGTAKQVQ